MRSPTGFLLRYPTRDVSGFVASLEVARSVLAGERTIESFTPAAIEQATDAVAAITRQMKPKPYYS